MNHCTDLTHHLAWSFCWLTIKRQAMQFCKCQERLKILRASVAGSIHSVITARWLVSGFTSSSSQVCQTTASGLTSSKSPSLLATNAFNCIDTRRWWVASEALTVGLFPKCRSKKAAASLG